MSRKHWTAEEKIKIVLELWEAPYKDNVRNMLTQSCPIAARYPAIFRYRLLWEFSQE